MKLKVIIIYLIFFLQLTHCLYASSIKTVSWEELIELNVDTGEMSPNLKNMINQNIAIAGFIVPLDNEGYVAEGSGENIFIVRDGRLVTPELTSCLEGITRDTIFVLAEELGLSIEERRITRDEVYIADEAFFTGTAAEVVPIRELDGRVIGSGKRGSITEQLQEKYFGAVRGKYEEHSSWLAPADS